MKALIRYSTVGGLLILSLSLQAQIWLSHQDIFDQAEEFFLADEYVEALPLYHLLEKKEVETANISYRIGACYLNIRGKKDRAIPYLEEACISVSNHYQSTLDEDNAPLKALLLLGVAYRIDGQLDKATETFNILKDSIQEVDPEFVSVIDMHLQRCENARMLNAFPGEPRTELLPAQINNAFSNYNPVLVGHDSILFYMEERKFYDAIMRVEMVNGEWGIPENMTPVLGSDGDHVLVGANQTADKLLLSFYEPLRAGEIYESHVGEDGKWTPIIPLNENINTPFHETHASLSADGKTLYFTSNRNGGYGGLDIYKSKLDENNEWGSAQNLGEKINTPYNEETPIINADDEILYFSSQGHLSMGGYDIFYALRKGEDEWRRPINMGAPVSTTDDDLFYYPLEEHVSGLMSRLENPANGYDIYRYNSMVFANSPRFAVRGKVPNVDTANYDEYTLAIVQKGTQDTLVQEAINPDGNYDLLLPAGDFEVVVLQNKDTKLTRNLSLNEESPEDSVLEGVLATTDTAQEKEADAEPEAVPEKEVTPVSATPAAQVDTFMLRPIRYGFDTFVLSTSDKDYLDQVTKLFTTYPGLQTTIEGHTDDQGPEDYNQYLSQKRAEIVQTYLLDKGVSREKISVKAYGESQPVAQNTFPDGRGNIIGRSYNRRVVLVPVNTVEGLEVILMGDIPEEYLLK